MNTNTTEGQTMSTNENPTPSASTRRIYVACLSAYNAGILHGAWIDANQGAEAIEREVIARVLLTSPAPNVTRCKVCGEVGPAKFGCTTEDGQHDPAPSSEEWAIHDYEGFGRIELNEHDSFETVAKWAALLNDHEPIVIQQAREYMGRDPDQGEIEDWIGEHYRGEFDSVEDYARELIQDTNDMGEWPVLAQRYFDYEAFARDLVLGGDVTAVKSGGRVHIFDGY